MAEQILFAPGTPVAHARTPKCTAVSAIVLGGIVGWLGEDATQTTFITLESHLDADSTAVLLPALQPNTQSTAAAITAANLSLPDVLEIPADATRLAKFGLIGVEQPGHYAVNVDIQIQDATNMATCELTVHVVASIMGRPSPTVAGGSDKVQAFLENDFPAWPFDEWIARLLLQEGALRSTLGVFLDNPNRGVPNSNPIPVKGVVRLRGEFRDEIVDSSDVYATASLSMPDGTVSDARIHVSRAALNADHYTGFAYFRFNHSSKRLVIPVDLSVRDGPIPAIALLLVALVLGFVVRPRLRRWLPLSVVYGQWRATRDEAKSMREGADKTLVYALLSEATTQIDRGDVDEATQSLRRARDWMRIHHLALRIDAVNAEHPKKKDLSTRLEALKSMMTTDIDKAEKDLTALEDAVREAELTPVFPRMILADEGAGGGGGPGVPAPLPPEPPDVRLPTRWVLRYAPDFVFFVLLIALLVIGAKTLYVDAPTFGARRLIDYGTVTGWGLGANAASGVASKVVGDKFVSLLSL